MHSMSHRAACVVSNRTVLMPGHSVVCTLLVPLLLPAAAVSGENDSFLPHRQQLQLSSSELCRWQSYDD